MKIFENGKIIAFDFKYVLEQVFLSLKIKKYNMYDWKQERTLAVTEKNIYNIKGKSNSLHLLFKN